MSSPHKIVILTNKMRTLKRHSTTYHTCGVGDNLTLNRNQTPIAAIVPDIPYASVVERARKIIDRQVGAERDRLGIPGCLK